MTISKRKVGFYHIVLNTEQEDYQISHELDKILSFIGGQESITKKADLSAEKFCLLESCLYDSQTLVHRVVFKSAVHSYRAPLLDRELVTERDNPKLLQEGEIYKTHFVIKSNGDDVILVAEKFKGGLTVRQFIAYLNKFKQNFCEEDSVNLNYCFSYETIAKDNIDEELEKLSRVMSADIYVDKQLLGGEALNFSQRLETVQESIIVEVRASRSQSIKETIKDVLAKFNGGERFVNKIKIKGRNSSNNEVTIDTEFIEKVEHVEAQLNSETGEVNSTYILRQMSDIANAL